MKTAFLSILLALSTMAISAQSKINLEISVSDLEDREGVLLISFYDSPATYMQTPSDSFKINLSDTDEDIFELAIKPGQYAISILHDKNMNGRIDMGPGGPVEAYGFSNDAPSMYGPAKYEDALLDATVDKKINIKLH